MNLGFTTKLSLHRLHTETVGLDPTITTTLADRLVDHHSGSGLGGATTFAQTA